MRNLPIDVSTNEIQPWHSLGGIEHICELRKSCMVLYGIFTELARMIYHDKDGRLIGTPEVVWNSKGTDIWIDNELRWEDQHPEVRPAIYIQLSPLEYHPFIDGYNSKILSANRFGERHYEHKVSGQVTFMHVASTSGEACALADNTDYSLSMLQDPICSDFCFTKFVSVGRTPLEKLPKEACDKYASGVTFLYEFSEAWDVKEECPILKSIDLLSSESKVDDLDNNSTRRKLVNRDNIFTENKGLVNSSLK